MYYVIVAIVALFIIFIMIELSYYNKFQLLNIKISEALNNIDILFEKKFNLIERCTNVIKDNNDKYKEDIILDNLLKIKNQKLNRFELNKELTLALRDYYSLLDLDKDLSSISTLSSIGDNLLDVENDLNAAKNFYNDTIVEYNNLVKCFPSKIVAHIKKYEVMDFFKEDKLETLEILKENNK